MKTFKELTGYDKAAIVFDILGDSIAINMFNDIPEHTFYNLRRHANEIRQSVSTSVKKEVLDDYYFKMLSADKYQEETLDENLFEFLEKLDDEQIYELLSLEKPKVIALALEQIDNNKRMKFFSRIDKDLENKIVFDTGKLNDIPLRAVIHTAKELKKKATFLPNHVNFSRGGGHSVSNMLSEMSESDAKKYLSKMELDDPDLLKEVKKTYVLFDDLLSMPETAAAKFWVDPDIDVDILAKSLKEYDTEIVGKIQAALPGKKQAMFSPLGEEDVLSNREIEAAKKEVKAILTKKLESGDMNIEDILGEPEVD